MTSITDTIRVGNGGTDRVFRRLWCIQPASGKDLFNGGNYSSQQLFLPKQIATGEAYRALGFSRFSSRHLESQWNDGIELEDICNIVNK